MNTSRIIGVGLKFVVGIVQAVLVMSLLAIIFLGFIGLGYVI